MRPLFFLLLVDSLAKAIECSLSLNNVKYHGSTYIANRSISLAPYTFSGLQSCLWSRLEMSPSRTRDRVNQAVVHPIL